MTRPSVAGPTGIVIGDAGVDRFHAALHAVGRLHRDRSHAVLAQVLLDLDDDVDRLAAFAVRLDADGVVDLGQVAAFELDVDDRADDLDDLADFLCCCDCHVYLVPLSFQSQLSALRLSLTAADSCQLERLLSITPARPRRLR